ncbi:hypothetical protein B5F39_06540 [Cloacibacillus sp. An23]|nr:hypothetical protein B5F39_06540 [Cloacibacillus sp. An23]
MNFTEEGVGARLPREDRAEPALPFASRREPAVQAAAGDASLGRRCAVMIRKDAPLCKEARPCGF